MKDEEKRIRKWVLDTAKKTLEKDTRYGKKITHTSVKNLVNVLLSMMPGSHCVDRVEVTKKLKSDLAKWKKAEKVKAKKNKS